MKKANVSFKLMSCFIALALVGLFLTQDLLKVKTTEASVLGLPEPSTMVLVSDAYSLPLLRGMRIDPVNPLHFKFIIDKADAAKVSQEEAMTLVNYFLAGLTTPIEDVWVNLSPYEKDRVVEDSLGITDMGRDMLAQDYVLKQLASSLTHPETPLGKAYWDLENRKSKIEKRNDFNKIWIIPNEAEVKEDNGLALITKSSLKVMTEADYLAMEMNNGQIYDINSDVMRSGIVPEIEKDVNQGKNFAKLRQVYNSLILSIWFKKKFEQSFFKHYMNKNMVEGIDIEDKQSKDKIFNLYVEAFKKGAYNYIKKEYNPKTNKKQKHRYFSGGENMAPLKEVFQSSAIKINEALISSSSLGKLDELDLNIKATGSVSSSIEDKGASAFSLRKLLPGILMVLATMSQVGAEKFEAFRLKFPVEGYGHYGYAGSLMNEGAHKIGLFKKEIVDTDLKELVSKDYIDDGKDGFVYDTLIDDRSQLRTMFDRKKFYLSIRGKAKAAQLRLSHELGGGIQWELPENSGEKNGEWQRYVVDLPFSSEIDNGNGYLDNLVLRYYGPDADFQIKIDIDEKGSSALEAISMEEVKANLNKLGELMDHNNKLYDQFGQFLAEHLKPEMNVPGFMMAFTLAIHELRTGVDGFTNKPIINDLVGHPPAVYSLIMLNLPEIVEAVAPADFAEEVIAVYENIKNTTISSSISTIVLTNKEKIAGLDLVGKLYALSGPSSEEDLVIENATKIKEFLKYIEKEVYTTLNSEGSEALALVYKSLAPQQLLKEFKNPELLKTNLETGVFIDLFGPLDEILNTSDISEQIDLLKKHKSTFNQAIGVLNDIAVSGELPLRNVELNYMSSDKSKKETLINVIDLHAIREAKEKRNVLREKIKGLAQSKRVKGGTVGFSANSHTFFINFKPSAQSYIYRGVQHNLNDIEDVAWDGDYVVLTLNYVKTLSPISNIEDEFVRYKFTDDVARGLNKYVFTDTQVKLITEISSFFSIKFNMEIDPVNRIAYIRREVEKYFDVKDIDYLNDDFALLTAENIYDKLPEILHREGIVKKKLSFTQSSALGTEIVNKIQGFFDHNMNMNENNAGRLDATGSKVVQFDIDLTDESLTQANDRSGIGYRSEVIEKDGKLNYQYTVNPEQSDFDITSLLNLIKTDSESTLTYKSNTPDFESYLGRRWNRMVESVTSSSSSALTKQILGLMSLAILSLNVSDVYSKNLEVWKANEYMQTQTSSLNPLGAEMHLKLNMARGPYQRVSKDTVDVNLREWFKADVPQKENVADNEYFQNKWTLDEALGLKEVLKNGEFYIKMNGTAQLVNVRLTNQIGGGIVWNLGNINKEDGELVYKISFSEQDKEQIRNGTLVLSELELTFLTGAESASISFHEDGGIESEVVYQESAISDTEKVHEDLYDIETLKKYVGTGVEFEIEVLDDKLRKSTRHIGPIDKVTGTRRSPVIWMGNTSLRKSKHKRIRISKYTSSALKGIEKTTGGIDLKALEQGVVVDEVSSAIMAMSAPFDIASFAGFEVEFNSLKATTAKKILAKTSI